MNINEKLKLKLAQMCEKAVVNISNSLLSEKGDPDHSQFIIGNAMGFLGGLEAAYLLIEEYESEAIANIIAGGKK